MAPSPQHNGERTLFIGDDRSSSFHDTGLPVSWMLEFGGENSGSQNTVSVVMNRFVLFYGEKSVVVALPNGKALIEPFAGGGRHVQDVAYSAFEAGHSAVIRIYTVKDGDVSEEGRTISTVFLMANGQFFQLGKDKLDQVNAVNFTAEDLSAQVLQRDLDLLRDLQKSIESALLNGPDRDPDGFARRRVAAFDTATSGEYQFDALVKLSPVLDWPEALKRVAQTAIQAPVVPSITRRPLGKEITAINEDGSSVPAINIVRHFATDMLDEAERENWPYDDDPSLRAKEDQVFRSWLKPEAGSVKLLGPSGVGKDTLVRRIAVRMLRGDCPETFKKQHLWEFNAGALSAGTSLRGQTEARMMAIVALAGSGLVLFSVSEAHVLESTGASLTSGGVMQIAKPALASGKMKWIVNDTPGDWDKAFGGDSALNRRFTRVDMAEPMGAALERMLLSWWARFGKGTVGLEELREVIRLADLYAIDGAQPSRSTALLNDLVSARHMSGRADAVTVSEVVAEAISLWHIPPEEFSAALGAKKHDELARALDENLVGQRQAKDVILQQDRAVLTKVNDPNLPRFRIVLLGPKGVGKTTAVDVIARVKSNGGQPMRIMLSEYKSSQQVAELKRQIATYADRDPHGVLFFDEAEKGHPDAQQAALSIWDKGELTVEYATGGLATTKLIRLHTMKIFIAGNAGEVFISKLTGPEAQGPNPIGFITPTTAVGVEPAVTGSEDFKREAQVRKAAEADRLDPYLLDRADVIAVFYPPTREEFRGIIEAHVRKALREISAHARLNVVISGVSEMSRDLAAAYYQPNASNREAVRIVSRSVRDAVANARFQLERSSIDAGGNGTAMGSLEMVWRDGALRLPAGPSTVASNIVEFPMPHRPACGAIFSASR